MFSERRVGETYGPENSAVYVCGPRTIRRVTYGFVITVRFIGGRTVNKPTAEISPGRRAVS